jgi:hypothetical protein
MAGDFAQAWFEVACNLGRGGDATGQFGGGGGGGGDGGGRLAHPCDSGYGALRDEEAEEEESEEAQKVQEQATKGKTKEEEKEKDVRRSK